MDRYTVMKEIGGGSGGNVFKAYHIHTKELVAIKKMKRKFFSFEEVECLRELKALSKLNHPNVITLKEAIFENQDLYFVFEHMDKNLYEAMKERGTYFSEEEIKSILYQILGGLAYVHERGYFHRDLKPENILIKDGVVKVADLGSARELDSRPPYTEYISTRWYRAPEVLLKCNSYGPAIDMWAVGAILAELFRRSPLFPGNSELDQLCKICNVLGIPDDTIWPEVMTFPRSMDLCLIQEKFEEDLSEAIPNASFEAIDLFTQLCSWDPGKRPTAEQALQHPFFKTQRFCWGSCVPEPPLEDCLTRHAERIDLELNLWDDDGYDDGYIDESALELTLGPKGVSSKDVWPNQVGVYEGEDSDISILDALSKTSNISEEGELNLDLTLFNHSLNELIYDSPYHDSPPDYLMTDFLEFCNSNFFSHSSSSEPSLHSSLSLFSF